MIAYAVSVSVFLYFVYCNKGKIVSPFRGMKYLYLIIILGTVIRFISMSLGKFETRDFIRDIYYFTNPLFVIINGAYFKKRLKEDSLFFNSIVAVAGVIGSAECAVDGTSGEQGQPWSSPVPAIHPSEP